MRRLTALLVVPAFLLAACNSENPSATGSDGWHRTLPAPAAAVARPNVPKTVAVDAVLPTVSGRFGTSAGIAIPKSPPTGRFVVAPQTPGHDRAAHTGDIVVVNYTAVVWRSGKELPGPYDKLAHPQVFAVGRGSTLPALDRAVLGGRAGSRVLVVAPPAAAYGATGNARLGVSRADTIVFVVDIMKVIDRHATVSGEQRGPGGSLPEVRMDQKTGSASIAVPDRAAPHELVVQPLVAGTGPRVKAGQTVVLQHSSTAWQSAQGQERAEPFMSSQAEDGPLIGVVGRGNFLKGWDRALVGRRTGSRLLLVLPANLAFGPHPPKGIPAGATVVSVIDILEAA